MPVISVGRDKLFKALGREYSKLLLLPAVACAHVADACPLILCDPCVIVRPDSCVARCLTHPS